LEINCKNSDKAFKSDIELLSDLPVDISLGALLVDDLILCAWNFTFNFVLNLGRINQCRKIAVSGILAKSLIKLCIDEPRQFPFLASIFHDLIKTIEGLTDAVLGFMGMAEACLLLNNTMLTFKVQKPGLSRSRCMGRGRSLIFKMEALLLGMALR
jgi:hypothetical protein